MSFLSSIGSFIMTPLYYLVSVVLVAWHHVIGLVLNPASGLAWGLSIIGLTVVIRAALIPLFVKQIKASRNMQLLQPKIKELQKKYGHDREKFAQEQMKLFKESNTNPLASCLPLLVQMPIFIALFRLINAAAGSTPTGHGVLSDGAAKQMGLASLFGVKISNSFTHAGGNLTVQIIAAALVIAMTLTTFLTQRQLMSKNMPADAMTGQYAQQQKMLLYVLPLVFAVGGIAFPIGLLLYWTTSNLWTMCQQFYVIRNNPAPNTEAFRAKERRDEAKAQRKGLLHGGPTPEPGATGATGGSTTITTAAEDAHRPSARQQPKKQTRQQRRTGKGR